jgi:hypothetical protein
MYIPLDEIGRESLLVEIPALVHVRGHLKRVLPGEHGELEDATGVDECLACQGVDVQRVTVVWAQQLVHGVHYAELPVCRDHERLDHRVRVQPANTHTRAQRSVFPYQ